MSDGHKVPGCPGKWVDISTLSKPNREKCTDCRATRGKRPEMTLEEILDQPDDDDYPVILREEPGMTKVTWSLIIAAIVAAVVVIVALW